MKFRVKITDIGEIALDFLSEKMLIIFNNNAPAELAEISVLHEINELKEDVVTGDIVSIGKKEYLVTAVGYEANHTLKNLGHCTFKFNGLKKAELPGIIHLEGKETPEIRVGDYIVIK